MNAAADALPHILFEATTRRVPAGLEYMDVNELRKRGRVWLGFDPSRQPRDQVVAAVRKAMENDANVERILKLLSPQERAVAAVYRRYGGVVDGEVIRMDLMARGLLEIVERRFSDHYTERKWKHEVIRALASSWVLLPEWTGIGYYYAPHFIQGPDNSFERYSLHAGIARRIEPAGPPPAWSLPPAEEAPRAATVTRRWPAEVALDLSRVFSHVAGRGSVKVRKDGTLATPALRAMEKTVPLDKGAELPLPDPYGFHFELLRQAGMVRIEGNEAFADPMAAGQQFGKSSTWQAHSWARGWLLARDWFDGFGSLGSSEREHCALSVRTGRQVLAWVLGCLARAGDRWYNLETLLAKLYANLRHCHFSLPSRDAAWNPRFPAAPGQDQTRGGQQRAWWFRKGGVWYANAVVVTLVALGLVERARLGSDPAAPYGFRLTEIGRAVFGAPELTPPAEARERRCLVIQPNFDIIAYLDQADAPTAGLLGRLAESGSARLGPVQTFCLTQTSVYQAQENGVSHPQIVLFLQEHAQRDLPANVLRSLADWAGKRERLTLHSGTTVLGFPTTAERDAYLEQHPGTACGERFVLVASPATQGLKLPQALTVNHLQGVRRTMELDEQGWISMTQPLDVVQKARLYRIALPPRSTSTGWRLTGESIRRAMAAGLKPAVVHRWLQDHLVRQAPPLIALAIDAWMGKARSLELGDAVLLHVPDLEQAKAIATSPRLRPFLLGRPGTGWIVVRKESRREFANLLEELGFKLVRELSHEGFSETGRSDLARS